MEIALFFWLPLCFLVAWLGSQKGRSGVGFFFLSLFLSPLVGLLAVIAVPARTAPGHAAPVKPNDLHLCRSCNRPSRASMTNCPYCGTAKYDPMAGLKKCPACAETIKAEAIKCRFCGTDLGAALSATTSAPKLAGSMGYCPGCKKLRHASVAKCVYCGSTEPVPGEVAP